MQKTLLPGSAIVAALFAMTITSCHAPHESGSIKVSGTIEAVTTELSFKTAGRVRERLVDEGESVAAGQIVARLENSEARQELAIREAELAVAQATVAELRAGSRSEEIAQAEASVARFKAEMQRTSDEFVRSEQLFKREVISRRDLEQAVAARDSSAAALRESSERLRQANNGARSETRQQAAARLQSAVALADIARIRLDETTLTAPSEGIVLSKNVEAGEYVAPGTAVVTIGRTKTVWIRGYVPEYELPRMKLGQVKGGATR